MNNQVNIITDSKLAELKKFLPVLLMAPYTRLILLAGSLAAGNPKPESDVDVIIVSQNNRIWLNRFFLEVLTRAFEIRRTKKDFANKICFNIFLSHKQPILPHQDSIGAGFYKNLKPVWGSELEIKNFWGNNSWIKKFNEIENVSLKKIILDNNSVFIKTLLEKILDYSGLGWLLEKISYRFQVYYLTKKFNQIVINKNSDDFDFKLTPNLIAYHFPISNYARAKKYSRSAVENNPTYKK
ncbi:MAG: nucleotidyltransferase domain-containing protein [Candidatus Sungbacteria bacterium]|uniref:Nucleotidyltransferase domain-containing protein n=1 Tax=Candidatus Sungiibacteriota bacterium TaxID=2750080 RepID=A0A931YDZ2_9BACT|nr:nucleotidyltransferase domain-containing protein [Candidatus Sungbacteria bacterium]